MALDNSGPLLFIYQGKQFGCFHKTAHSIKVDPFCGTGGVF